MALDPDPDCVPVMCCLLRLRSSVEYCALCAHGSFPGRALQLRLSWQPCGGTHGLAGMVKKRSVGLLVLVYAVSCMSLQQHLPSQDLLGCLVPAQLVHAPCCAVLCASSHRGGRCSWWLVGRVMQGR
jgi:hypothetical protein